MRAPNPKRRLGSALLLGLVAFAVSLPFLPGVRAPLARTVRTVATDLFAGDTGLLRLPVGTTEGVRPGEPVFLAARPGALRPAAHVARVGDGEVWIRFAVGEDGTGPFRLRVLPPPRGFEDTLRLAVSDETLDLLTRELSGRLLALLREHLLPDLEARLPGFLGRIDPRTSPEARRVLEGVGGEVVERLKPFADDLVSQIARSLEQRFDLLDRVGLLWKVVRGDAKGLRREIQPVAVSAAEAWWQARGDEVIGAVGAGVAARTDEWKAWLGGEVLEAAREELGEPLLREHRARLERAAEDALGRVVDEVVAAPEGGFRVRFASVLRTRLLDKDAPLLLLEALP
jgi:hypothetical protein